ncbi:unnamed protein product [Rotaria sp. Silwood1]|nr:unnamed protein product [Rotaria sp. Silwood1]CAF3450848.1 unnamed protein product [Rotaria sp. Silwood1]CAF4546893.1 unnamed protein product [Rotaria sp. Silwood1]CAF4805872.1 unnamed protein product [Rotaria sp. Silwood1]
MLLGNIREDLHPNCRTSRSTPHLTRSFSIKDTITTPLTSSSTSIRTSIEPQQTMMNYARMSYRYTTVTLLSMRPPPDTTIFPDHLVERRFLDDENYIDLDRMLAEKGGKFRLDSYGIRDGAGDGPIIPTRIHKYDFSDPVVIEKVKNRRPKDPLTPHQVAALTSVVTRHQSSTFPTPLSSPHQIQSSHVWIDDYSHRQAQFEGNKHRYHLPTQSSLSYQRQNPNQCEIYTNQIKSLLPNYQSNNQQNTNTVPILQRLFQAQQRQQNEQRKIDVRNQQSSPYINTPMSTSEHRQIGLSAFCTPTSPEQSNSYNTFAWPFSMAQNQKPVTNPLHIPISTQTTDVLTQLINEQFRYSATMQTSTTSNIDINVVNNINRDDNNDDDDDEQNFYSAPPSPTKQQDTSRTLFNNSNNLEHTRIYNQAVLLNSLIRNMVNERDIKNSSSNESCFSNDTQSTNCNQEDNESYTEMYNLIRLLSPGVKNVAQQELLQYLEQGCLNERNEMIRLVGSLNINEQNSLKPILLRLINEQLDIMKKQQQIQQGNSTSIPHQHSQETRSTLESWFGSDIYTNAYPRMPSGRVISACDLEQSRLTK